MASQSLVGLFILMVGMPVATSQSQYHTSDPHGNFKVSYRTSDGQYLVEDRSADGTSLLGNFGYRSSGGEQVGVAYGSDGAGFVIRSPSAAPSTYGAGSTQQQRQYQQPQQQQPVASQYHATNTGQSYNSGSGYDAFVRYQEVNYPASNRAPSRDVTTSSNSIIANGGEVTPSTTTQTPSNLAQHDAGQSHISYYNAATPQYHTPSYTAQLSSLPTYSSIGYIVTPEVAKSPFTYSFSSYNDPYHNQQYITSQQYVPPASQYVQATQNVRYRPNYQRASYQPLPTVATDLRTVIAQTLAHQRQYYNGPSANSAYPYYSSLVRPYYL